MTTTEQRAPVRWRVRQWTIRAWDRTIEEPKVRKDHEDNMMRLAAQMEATLTAKCPQYNPSVKQVRCSHRPQFLFELTIDGQVRDRAAETAVYWIGRAMGACKGLPIPPLGKQEVEVAPDGEG